MACTSLVKLRPLRPKIPGLRRPLDQSPPRPRRLPRTAQRPPRLVVCGLPPPPGEHPIWKPVLTMTRTVWESRSRLTPCQRRAVPQRASRCRRRRRLPLRRPLSHAVGRRRRWPRWRSPCASPTRSARASRLCWCGCRSARRSRWTRRTPTAPPRSSGSLLRRSSSRRSLRRSASCWSRRGVSPRWSTSASGRRPPRPSHSLLQRKRKRNCG
mmetsp:Transcript_3482/g.8310  ORF Transcript_3482/g.8310 Transcript_3482/m.8310 type:complete len:212 (-) Transcript_3482:2792-3427(-)